MRIAFIGAMHVSIANDEVWAHLSLGRVLDGLAASCDELLVSLPVDAGEQDETRDFRLDSANTTLCPQPMYSSSAGAMKKMSGVVRSYWRAVASADVVVIRGMVPFLEWVYLACLIKRVRPVHWLVGNPQALLASHQRVGLVRGVLYRIAADVQSVVTRVGRNLTNGWLLCNGDELARLYSTQRTIATISSTVRDDEISQRVDACQVDGRLNILFVGFVRPEKGIEYLLQAFARLDPTRNRHLTIVGTFGGFRDYKEKVESEIESLGLADRITWAGYIPYGDALRAVFAQTDILVLPTLSEGTPRVLIEARANGVPVIATRVGGIPTSVTHGVDGWLVPAKDAEAIHEAIEAIASNPEIARGLILAGYETARANTVERFVDQIVGICREAVGD